MHSPFKQPKITSEKLGKNSSYPCPNLGKSHESPEELSRVICFDHHDQKSKLITDYIGRGPTFWLSIPIGQDFQSFHAAHKTLISENAQEKEHVESLQKTRQNDYPKQRAASIYPL